jgi:hypothetical protein
LLAAVLAVYLADLVTHLSSMAAMRDLVVYRDGGLIVRHVSPAYDPHRSQGPSPLYDWTGQNGVQFTYPPFAAVIFAVASVLSWTAMRWAMTLASLAALGLSLWLVFGALGYKDRLPVRLGATLIRRYRQAATAAGVFAATAALGYAFLPRDSGTYWAHGPFLKANRIVFLGARGNQSLRGIATRLAGSVSSGTVPWIAAAALVAVAGLIVAALLYRARQPVPAMLACALTGLRPAAPAEVECVDHWGIGGGLRASVRSWRQIPRLPARLLTRRFGVAAGRIERGHHVGAA